jgi:hypothetical protein
MVNNCGFKEYYMKYWREPYDTNIIKITKGKVVIIEGGARAAGIACILPRSSGLFKGFNKRVPSPYVQKPDECVNCHIAR